MPTNLHPKQPVELEIQKIQQNQNAVEEIVSNLQKLTIKVGNSTKRLITKGTLIAVAGTMTAGGLGTTLAVSRYSCEINTWANTQLDISIAKECLDKDIADINQKIANLEQANIVNIQNAVAPNPNQETENTTSNSSNSQALVEIIGATGIQGIQGIQGLIGAVGDQGIQGIQGLTGNSGEQGPKGDKGEVGQAGANGLNGSNGSNGAQGATGSQGLQGLPGTSSNVGATGDQGIQGIQGLTGAVGAAGIQGIQGIQGLTGAQGPKGDTGDTGAVGQTGLTGNNGADGIDGEVGSVGATGTQGIQGEIGMTGVTGDTGAQGLQGIAGVANIQTASNGLTLAGNELKLGGILSEPTTLSTDSVNTLSLTGLQAPGSDYEYVVIEADGTLRKATLEIPAQIIPLYYKESTTAPIILPINTANQSLVLGSGSSTNSDESYIIGRENTITTASGYKNNYVLGNNNTSVEGRGNSVVGGSNTVNGGTRLSVIGYNNQMGLFNDGGIFGSNNNIANFGGNNSFVLGSNITNNDNNSVQIGTSQANKLTLGSNGSITFQGALQPNGNAGTAGQLLISQGDGLAPIWSDPNFGGTLDNAYNYGGPAAGRFIGIVDEQPVDIYTDVNPTSGNSTPLTRLSGLDANLTTSYKQFGENSLGFDILSNESLAIRADEYLNFASLTSGIGMSGAEVGIVQTTPYNPEGAVLRLVANNGPTPNSDDGKFIDFGNFGSVGGGVGIYSGLDSPEGKYTGRKGSIYLRSGSSLVGEQLYFKSTEGELNTGWIPVSQGSQGWNLQGNNGTNPATDFIGTINANPLNFRTGNVQRMTINGSGNVAIGNGANANNGTFTVSNNGNPATTNTALFEKTLDGVRNITMATNATGPGAREFSFEAKANGKLALYAENNLAKDNLVIDSNNQFIGIGTQTPTEKLDIAGNLKFSGALMPNNLAGTTGQVLTSQGTGAAPLWTTLPSGSGGTLNQAYNFGGPADGRTINTLFNQPVLITSDLPAPGTIDAAVGSPLLQFTDLNEVGGLSISRTELQGTFDYRIGSGVNLIMQSAQDIQSIANGSNTVASLSNSLVLNPSIGMNFLDSSFNSQFGIQNNGETQFNAYPVTRDDTFNFAANNFLYTDEFGNMKSAPLSCILNGTCDNTQPPNNRVAQATFNSFTPQPVTQLTNQFNEVITFVSDIVVQGVSYLKNLVVQGTAIFQGRVTFEDTDMSGQTTIPANKSIIYVPYSNSYTTTPVVTVSGLGHGTLGYIQSSNTNGFTIAVDQTSSRDLKFNWIAIHNGRDNTVEAQIPAQTIIPNIPLPVFVNDTIQPEVNTDTDTNPQ